MRVALAVRTEGRIAGTVADRLREGVDRLELVAASTRCAGELDVLVVLGGDGAVHHAVQFCAGTGTALGVVPAGHGNDFARALGVPLDPLAAVDALVASLRAGRRRCIDLGKVGETWFATVLCAGFDASVGHRAARLPWPKGPRRYDVAVLAELASWRSRRLTVCTDTDRFELDATLIAVGNTGCYGGGVPICPHARPDDGLFDVTVVGEASRRDLIRMMPSLRTGRHLAHPAVRTFQTRALQLSSTTPCPSAADGEPLHSLPLSARCVPSALTVVA